jgi:hypothetical protein
MMCCYSQSVGLHMDLHRYLDLDGGRLRAYEDDRVFLIRLRPIIGIQTRFKPEENLPSDYMRSICVATTVCCAVFFMLCEIAYGVNSPICSLKSHG